MLPPSVGLRGGERRILANLIVDNTEKRLRPGSRGVRRNLNTM